MSRKKRMRLPAEVNPLRDAKAQKGAQKPGDENKDAASPEIADDIVIDEEFEDGATSDAQPEQFEGEAQYGQSEDEAQGGEYEFSQDDAQDGEYETEPDDEEDREYEAGPDEAEDEEYGSAQDESEEGQSALANVETQEDEQARERAQRRLVRRKRRIRNQIIAYVALFVFLAGLAVGALFVGKYFLGSNEEAKTPPKQENKPDDMVVVNPPDITEEPTPTPTPQVNPADEVARYYIEQMTLEEKVAGLFFVRPEDIMTGVSKAVVAGNKTKEALSTYAVGGLIYFDKNIQTKTQITDMLNGTREMSKYPIFFGIDEEGGTIARVADSLSEFANTGNASVIGATGDANKAYMAYYEIATYLAKIGFNVDFAPVADIYDGNNAMFEKRAFGMDPETVKSFVYQAVCGLQDNRISACLKHFPGHGRANSDTHDGMAVSNVTEEELIAYEILPFQMALAASPDFVMVSHVSYPNILSGNTPACMSSDIVTRILRDQLGYDGIVITDAMNMAAVSEYYTAGDAAVNALLAGCDMILMPENFKEAYQGVLNAVRNGELSEEQINRSLMRIYRVKCAGMTLQDVAGE